MAKKQGTKRTHELRPLKCCTVLAENLGADENDCFEDGPTSGSEPKTGVKVVFRYNQGVRRGMCRLDLRCYLKDWNDKQCDFLFYRCTTGMYYFVELKKPQVWKDAYDQITNTINYFLKKDKSDIDKKKIAGYIVSRNAPPNANLLLRDLKYKFEQNSGYSQFGKVNIGEEIWID